jgi:serine/threonine-protein kinase
LAANVILDIQACRPQQPAVVTQAGDIADRIEARLPR